ncbi:MAG: glycosyltransferase [Candidatus Sumerlaeaceae bacterium]
MNVVIFGAGPMPSEPHFAVTAPGSRTWQIVRTVAQGMRLVNDMGTPPHITILGLEGQPRTTGEVTVSVEIPVGKGPGLLGTYIPLTLEQFRDAGVSGRAGAVAMPEEVHAVVGTASVQPYSSASSFANLRNAPLWIDVFGDPLTEMQTQADLHRDEEEANGQRCVHSWKLLLDSLLRGDVFSALSERQRFALLGELGAAGRLNQFTARDNMVHAIPFGLFPDEVPHLSSTGRKGAGATFTVMWCGSFNTWMDVDVLLNGFLQASHGNPRLRLMVVGGRISGYNDASYDRFVEGVRKANAESIVQLMDWQPLGRMRELYASCDVGLSIDRFSYEAVLGSRTRIINFLAAGKPVMSTIVTELTEDLADKGYVMPLTPGSSDEFAKSIENAALRATELAELGQEGQAYVLARYDARLLGQVLSDWISHPVRSPDHDVANAPNPLVQYWERVRAPLGD